jgi:tRNA pseudouridine55 synthase
VGHETDTGDGTGQIVADASIDFFPSIELWQQKIPDLTGKIMQRPPVYSAIKRDGKPLYQRARDGEMVTTEPREVFVESLQAIEAAPPLFTFAVRCGGGTYIRSLAQDWARTLGARAHLKDLRRTEALGFSIKDAYTLEDALACAGDKLALLPLQRALTHLPTLECDADTAKRIAHCNLPTHFLPTNPEPGFYLLQSAQKPLAILDYQNGWKLERVFLL